jgi:hypothetical protein
MTRSSATRVLAVVLAAVFVLRSAREYLGTVETWRHARKLTYASFFRQPVPGLAPAVEWIKAQGTIREVYGLDHAEDRYLYQRLTEMLYPIAFRPLAGASLKTGDIVVLPRDRTVEGASKTVFQSGSLQILRVEP